MPITDKNKLKQAVNLFKQATEKECYKITLDKHTPDILDNKLGGNPYLPVGEKYPTTSDGKPLSLLLQVNLKEIKLPNFPDKGIFEVFTNNDFPCEFAIRLFDENLEYQTDFPALDYEFPFVRRSFKIKLSKDKAHMSLNDYKADQTLCPIIEKIYGLEAESVVDFVDSFDDGWDWYEEFANQLSNHPMTLGGYPDFTQSDPRSDEEELDECLFKIDAGSNIAPEIQIGDSGIIWGFINEKDLQNKNFNNAVVDWDCC